MAKAKRKAGSKTTSEPKRSRAKRTRSVRVAEAADMIPSTVQWRLHRLEALIRLLQAQQS